MSWQEALRRAEEMLAAADEEAKRGGDIDRAVALARVARGYIELAKAVKP